MDLFEYQRQKNMEKESPLAARIRPKSLADFQGQGHIVGRNTLLYRAIVADKLTSVILYGPPGTGKTTLAKIIAATTKSEFVQLNATTAGVKDIKETIERAKSNMGMSDKKTILFIDEIHRFNKLQQDALLPYVEDGTVVLIGATTENPFFEVNKALISRSTIFELKHLAKEDIKQIVVRALYDKDNGLGHFDCKIEEDGLDFLASIANGDARVALNGIELAAMTTEKSEDGIIHLTVEVLEQCVQRRSLNYDKDGDNHYDTISAFIKRMRGTDPDAAVYYLAKMLHAGEDPKFIARRIVICASEDVGNADPLALQVAVAAAKAVEFIGLPECRINLAHAALYVAAAPKSNAVIKAIDRASRDVETVHAVVPMHLRDAHNASVKVVGHGVGYKYAHDYTHNYVEQQYLPDALVGRVYYEPTTNGVEDLIGTHLKKLKEEE